MNAAGPSKPSHKFAMWMTFAVVLVFAISCFRAEAVQQDEDFLYKELTDDDTNSGLTGSSCLDVVDVAGMNGLYPVVDVLDGVDNQGECEGNCTNRGIECLGYEFSESFDGSSESICELMNQLPISSSSVPSSMSCSAKQFIKYSNSICTTRVGATTTDAGSTSSLQDIGAEGVDYISFSMNNMTNLTECAEACLALTANETAIAGGGEDNDVAVSKQVTASATTSTCYGFQVILGTCFLRRQQVDAAPTPTTGATAGLVCYIRPETLGTATGFETSDGISTR